MKRSVLIAALAVLSACAENTSNDAENEPIIDEIIVADTIADLPEPDPIAINDHLQTIMDKSDAVYTLPFTVDTNFVEEIDLDAKLDQDALNFENARYLAKHCLDNLPTINVSYILSSFCEIDSLRAEGEYEDYVSSLDIGMMKDADAYAEGIIEINPNQKIVLWSITYGTYEACPYASGTVVFGTLLTDYEVQNTMVLAEVSGGGDPPYWGETRISSLVSVDGIKTTRIETNGDYDEETEEDIIETLTDEYQADIIGTGFWIDPE